MYDYDHLNHTLSLAEITAAVAQYCDRAEHNEELDRQWVLSAARDLRALAATVADAEGLDIRELYAQRLTAIETRNVVHAAGSYDGAAAARACDSWRALQLVQIAHDKAYHADVIGLAKSEQLRHYALHLAKIAGAFASRTKDAAYDEEITSKRLPDMLLFGLKLSTVMGEKLAEHPLATAGEQQDAFALPAQR